LTLFLSFAFISLSYGCPLILSPLSIDDVIRMCTNVSSVEVIQHIQLCQRLIPKSWSSESSSKLCELSESKSQVESVVKCALDTQRLTGLPFYSNQMMIARVCSTEKPSFEVLNCLKSVSQGIRSISPTSSSGSSASSYQLTNETIIDICRSDSTLADASTSGPASFNAGECLVTVVSSLLSASHTTIQSDVPLAVCKPSSSSSEASATSSHNYKFLLHCLKAQHRKLITIQDVHKCYQEKRIIKDLRVKKLYLEEGDTTGGPEIIAGKRFSIVFEVYDQYYQLFTSPASLPFSPSVSLSHNPILKISINENNQQSAVIWGNRLNSTNLGTGSLSFHHLVISQPGKVEITISQLLTDEERNEETSHLHHRPIRKRDHSIPINSFQITIHEDPRMVLTRPCIYVFASSICPSSVLGEDYDSLFPLTRQFLPSSMYLANIQCFNESLSLMRVTSYLQSDGSMWVEYRLGIDSIWTGVGLPTIEMAPSTRLGLLIPSIDELKERNEEGEKKRVLKVIKRAYYRGSLQWHPDRWVGYDQYYQAAVSSVFPLITEAYEMLMKEYEN
jgi:hypothetical protein